MSGSEYGKRTGQHEQRTQQASLMVPYCDCGDYCAWCTDLDGTKCDICGTVYTADECPECSSTDWARDERARRAADQAAEDAAQEGE